MPHLAGAPHLVERENRIDQARRRIAPPVELDEVETFDPQAAQRAIDDPLEIGFVDMRERRQIRHELGVNLDRPHRLGAAQIGQPRTERADQFLDAGIDVGAVERRDAGVERRDEIVDRGFAVDRPMPARELPAAANDAGDFVIRAKFDPRDVGHFGSAPGSGAAVVSE